MGQDRTKEERSMELIRLQDPADPRFRDYLRGRVMAGALEE